MNCQKTGCRMILLASIAFLACIRPAPAQSKVELVKRGDSFQLLRNGAVYSIKGAAGDNKHFDRLAAAGGNSVRTWASDKLGETLELAHKHGLSVCAGLWMGHPRHGFNYQDAAAVKKQKAEKLEFVRKHMKHPALLIWSVGNEAEGDGTDPEVYRAINDLASAIKKIDPRHPTMTVIAELGENESKLKSIERLCPDIDIVGINSYGGIETLGTRFRQAGISKPYIVTEHGTPGPWEVGKTPWGSPLEITSTEKARQFAIGYTAAIQNHPGVALGSYAFMWGNKQETTATWFGMLLPDGHKLGAVDAMSRVWTGSVVKNHCPEIESIKADQAGQLKPGTLVNASVTAKDPDGDPLTVKWVLRSDSGTIGAGGDPQENETSIAKGIKSSGATVSVNMPKGGGGYRLFAYVYDGKGGAAVGNIPLHVGAGIELKTLMPKAKLPYVVYGDDAPASVFVASGFMGNAAAVSHQLNCEESPRSGKTCLKAEYKSTGAWGGVLWQSPANDWDGLLKGGANLTGATHLEFYVRGAQGGETVTFVYGVLDGNQPYRDTSKGELKDVKLSKTWTKMTIPLAGKDLRQIKTGFGWSLPGQGKPVTFYLDDIRYVQTPGS